MSETRSVLESRAAHLSLIAALLATFIGLLALGVSIYAVHWQRQAVRAQVWPILQFGHSNIGGFSVLLDNAGVGPADIRTVEITVDGKAVVTWKEALERLIGPFESSVVYSSLRHRIVHAGASFDAVKVADPKLGARIVQELGRIDSTICYCSVLGDCWTINGSDAPVAGPCKPVAKPFEN